MRPILCLILIFLFCACDFNDISEKDRLVDASIEKVSNLIKNEFGLIPRGSSSTMMYQIKSLGLFFDYQKPVDIETGRVLLIAAAEKFAAEINSNKAIRPYLDKYPFGPQNIEIHISLLDQNGKDVEPGKLSFLFAHEGVLEYKIDNLKTKLFTTIYKETYEEALEKLNHKKIIKQ